MNVIGQFLSQINPFKVLPPAELERVASRVSSISFVKGESMYSEGDPADNIWILKKGRIQIFKYSSQGRPLAIESILPGELFGTLCRMGGNGRLYPCTAIAATRSEVLKMSDREFWDMYNRFPALVLGVCSLCSQRLSAAQGVSCNCQEPVERRLALLLLSLKKKHGAVLPFTKRELSEQAGTTVETTIRVMSRFRKKGWIASARGEIEMKDAASIEKFIGAR